MPRSRPAASHRTAWVSILLPAVIAAASLSLRAADTIELTSAWRTEPIRIDGDSEDWYGRLQAVRGQRFSVGLANDADALYFCLVTTDRVLAQQITRQGLMIWLDPSDAKAKKHVFGVHFPIDPRLVAMRDPATIYSREPSAGYVPGDEGQSGVGILSGKGDAKRIPIEESGGIQARLSVHGEALVYELKVPLKGGAGAGSYFVNAVPGATVRFGLQTPEWRGPLPPQRGPVGVGVAVSAPGGRGVVGYPAMDATLLKPMELKASLRLASGQ
jgi:hypothetical protein